jgi:hypothetical protein
MAPDKDGEVEQVSHSDRCKETGKKVSGCPLADLAL